MKLFMSGAESKNMFEILTNVKQKYILMSYLYLKKRGANLQEYVDAAGYDIKFMIDSGGHTFHNKPVEHVLKKEVKNNGGDIDAALKEYIEGYRDWLIKNKEHISVAVELDISGDEWGASRAGTIPYSQVVEWRKDIFKPLIDEEGINIIFIPQVEDNGIESLIGQTDFFGISAVHNTAVGSYGKIFTQARNMDLKIHGFAVTGKEIRKYPFTTVDSTSWTMGQRFGITYYLTGGTMRTLDKQQKHRRKRFKNKCKEANVDYELFLADDDYEVAKWNCYQWKLYADYMEKRWSKRDPIEGEGSTSVVNTGEAEGVVGSKDNPDKPKSVIQFEEKSTDVEVQPWEKPMSFLSCDECYLGDKCPAFKEGSACTFGLDISLQNPTQVKSVLDNIVSIQYGRILRGKMVEEADGGVPDKILSLEIDLFLRVLTKIKELGDTTEKIEIRASGGKGIISEVFGGLAGKSKDSAKDATDVTPQSSILDNI